MHIFAVKERRKAPPAQRARVPSIHPAGPTLHAQRAEIRAILRTPRVQAKLTIGQLGDRYEQEADRVAEQVMAMPEPRLQRVCTECEEDLQGKKLRRQPVELEEEEEEELISPKPQPGHTPEVTSGLETRINALRGGGRPLNPAARAFFEPRFGHRIHRNGHVSPYGLCKAEWQEVVGRQSGQRPVQKKR